MTDDFGNAFNGGNEGIERAIEKYNHEPGWKTCKAVLETLRTMAKQNRQFLVRVSDVKKDMFSLELMNYQGKEWMAAFTSRDEYDRKTGDEKLYAVNLYSLIHGKIKSEGLLINPWGECFVFDKKLIDVFKAGVGWNGEDEESP